MQAPSTTPLGRSSHSRFQNQCHCLYRSTRYIMTGILHFLESHFFFLSLSLLPSFHTKNYTDLETNMLSVPLPPPSFLRPPASAQRCTSAAATSSRSAATTSRARAATPWSTTTAWTSAPTTKTTTGLQVRRLTGSLGGEGGESRH